jgi:C4-type Zn-finger protein
MTDATVTTHNHGTRVTVRIEDEGGISFITVERDSLAALAEKIRLAAGGVFDVDKTAR